MKIITIENLIPDQLLIFKTGELVETIDTTGITEYNYELNNGIYLFDNEGNQDVCFYLDEETKCKLYNKLCPDSKTYYYYVALTLVESCSHEYPKAVELYNRLIKLLEDDCDCLH